MRTTRAPSKTAAARRDLAALALFVVVLAAAAFPLVLNLRSMLVVDRDPDIYAAYWQNWHLVRTVEEGLGLFHTPYLFHPRGLDTTVQPRRYVGLVTWWPLARILGPTGGFNAESLLGLLVGAMAVYLLAARLTGSRLAGWFAGAFFTFYPYRFFLALTRPNSGHIEWIPVFILALTMTLERAARDSPAGGRGTRWAVAGCGLAGALNAYVNFKIFVLAGMLAAVYVPLHALSTGALRNRAYWRASALAASGALLLAAPVYVPYLFCPWLDHAIRQAPVYREVDLASYFVHRRGLAPLLHADLGRLLGMRMADWEESGFYAGAVSTVLVLVAACSRRRLRTLLPWLVPALLFLVFSLGNELHLDGKTYRGIWLPYRTLDNLSLFRGLRNPMRFALMFSLPWAVMAGYGLSVILGSRRHAPAVLIAAAATSLMMWEVWPEFRVERKPVSPFLQNLSTTAPGCAVIDLPMGRHPSKVWMYLQTYHGLPIAEGMSARMPPGAYRYINQNPLLRAFRKRERNRCRFDVRKAAGELIRDRFCFILAHRTYGQTETDRRVLRSYLRTTEPVYEDDFLSAYRLQDLRSSNPCPTRGKRGGR